jgi:hypothetical protein
LRESKVESRLVRDVSRAGGIAAKHVSPGRAGDPDRLVVIPRRSPCPVCGSASIVGLVEVKAPGQRPRPLQSHRIREWESVGMRVAVVSDFEQVGQIVRQWSEEAGR